METKVEGRVGGQNNLMILMHAQLARGNDGDGMDASNAGQMARTRENGVAREIVEKT